MKDNIFYTYLLLDPRYPGDWEYEGKFFKFKPFYAGKGSNGRMYEHTQLSSLAWVSFKNNTIRNILAEDLQPIPQKVNDALSNDEAFTDEIKIIKHFGREDLDTGILTNLTDGGSGFKQYKRTDEDIQKFSNARKGKAIGIHHFNSKCVSQYTLNDEFIKKWDYIGQAAQAFGVHTSNISVCCKGITKSCAGFKWVLDGSLYVKPTLAAPLSRNSKKVYQYSKDGTYIKSYISASDATRQTGITSITNNCRGEYSSAGEYMWFYSYQGQKIPSYNLLPQRHRLEILGFNNENILIKQHISVLNLIKIEGSGAYRALQNNEYYKGILWKYTNPSEHEKENFLCKTVYQYSSDGFYITSFTSAKEAITTTGFSSIYHCLQPSNTTIVRTAGGFQWFYEYKGDNIAPVTVGTRVKRVASYDENMKIIKIYNSIKEAQQQFKTIHRALNTGSKAYGMYWKYYDPENEISI